MSEVRKRLPKTRQSLTHKFSIHTKEGVVEGYVTVGLYEDGSPGEMFLVLARTGEEIRGMARCWAITVSLCLQNGVPLKDLIRQFKFFRFGSSGTTGNPEIPIAHSVADYVCRWLEITFLTQEEQTSSGPLYPYNHTI